LTLSSLSFKKYVSKIFKIIFKITSASSWFITVYSSFSNVLQSIDKKWGLSSNLNQDSIYLSIKIYYCFEIYKHELMILKTYSITFKLSQLKNVLTTSNILYKWKSEIL